MSEISDPIIELRGVSKAFGGLQERVDGGCHLRRRGRRGKDLGGLLVVIDVGAAAGSVAARLEAQTAHFRDPSG